MRELCGLRDSGRIDPVIVFPDMLADAEIARNFIAEAGALGAAIAVGGFSGAIGSDDLLHLFGSDQPALDGDGDKAEFGGSGGTGHQFASGTRT
ncbi:MAG: hypothetical protein AB7E24_17325 [Novosphingobium sp.]